MHIPHFNYSLAQFPIHIPIGIKYSILDIDTLRKKILALNMGPKFPDKTVSIAPCKLKWNIQGLKPTNQLFNKGLFPPFLHLTAQVCPQNKPKI